MVFDVVFYYLLLVRRNTNSFLSMTGRALVHRATLKKTTEFIILLGCDVSNNNIMLEQWIGIVQVI
jgi:hypothetical protein